MRFQRWSHALRMCVVTGLMRKKSSIRGKLPRGQLRSDVGLLEYIYRLSLNCEVDPDKFFEKIVSAWRHGECMCDGLRIVCRERPIDNLNSFLFTNGQKVIAQFPILERILTKTDPFGEITNKEVLKSILIKKKDTPKHIRIKNLRAGMKRVNLKAKVLEIPETNLVFTRFGSSSIVSNILIGDETGTIKLPLWNEQINTLSVDKIIQIENARVVLYRGELQMKIGRKGKITIIQDSESSDKKITNNKIKK